MLLLYTSNQNKIFKLYLFCSVYRRHKIAQTLFNCVLNMLFQNGTLAQWCITVREWTPVRVGQWEGLDPMAPVGLTLLLPGPPQ